MTAGLVLALLCLLAPAHGYFITIDAHAEECFFEKVTAGTKLGKGRSEGRGAGGRQVAADGRTGKAHRYSQTKPRKMPYRVCGSDLAA